MNNNAESNQINRSLAVIVAEIKQELKEFTQTRIEMLKTELPRRSLAGKSQHRWRASAPCFWALHIF